MHVDRTPRFESSWAAKSERLQEVAPTGRDATLGAIAASVRRDVDAMYGAILPGDLLAGSPTVDHATRPNDPMRGSVIGKALEARSAGRGVIRILVMPR